MTSNQKSTPNTPPSLFGPSPVLIGEDAAAYDELYGRICAAIRPSDVIDEMFVADIAYLESDVLRLRQVKSSIFQELRREALNGFVRDNVSYSQYQAIFAEDLAEFLLENVKDGRPEDEVRKLARDYADSSPEALHEVNSIFERINKHQSFGRLSVDDVLDDSKAKKAEELVREYVRAEQSAVGLVDELLADATMSIDDLMTDRLSGKLDLIERVDRLLTIAEARRNASLHEIERRRPALGERLRRRVREIEDVEFREPALDAIEAPSIKG